MSISLEWTKTLDDLVVEAFKAGRTNGIDINIPDDYIETGLAHVFFFGDQVLKLYKTHHEIDHFIKKVLVPTKLRHDFIQHDFTTNKHFSQGVYKELHSLYLVDDEVTIVPYDRKSIHTVILMDKLDFSQNLHEQMLNDSVQSDDLYLLGKETARLLDESEVSAPSDLNWYDQASRRIVFLKQFIGWLPDKYSSDKVITNCLEALDSHLEANKIEYKSISGDALTADLDNHDENIFIVGDTVKIIDVIPPMDCWWYGVPESNLTTLLVNVEAMMSSKHAESVKQGFIDYHGKDILRENVFEFSRAFDYLISIAHFASLDDKKNIADKYVAGCIDLPNRLSQK